MENMTSVCINPWCKATFIYLESDTLGDKKTPPSICKKCKSFDSDLSGGVSWKDRKYESDIYDTGIHRIKYNVTNFKP